MQSASTALTNALLKDATLYPSLRLVGEWNHNHYTGIEKVDNTPSEEDSGYDPDLFPIESIVQPNRPNRWGIRKARTDTGEPIATSSAFEDLPNAVRHYTVADDDIYQYWTSPGFSSNTASGGGYGFTTPVAPYVIYDKMVQTNKIVIGVESTWTWPTDYTVEINIAGAGSDPIWITAATNAPINLATGQIILYHQADNSWSNREERGFPMLIRGVRLTVNKISHAAAPFDLIQISARLEYDLTNWLIDWSTENTVSNESFITPLGQASSNTGSINLENSGGIFNNENPNSLFYGLLDQNVEFRLDVGFDTSKYGGSGIEWTRAMTMLTETWGGQVSTTCSVSLRDKSKPLQEIKPSAVLFQNMSVPEIIWRLCDMVGFVDYVYETSDIEGAPMLKYWWTKGDKTVWEIIAELTEALQFAVYFDELGFLQIKTRDSAFNYIAITDYSILAENAPNGQLANLITAPEVTGDFDTNKVNVKYYNTHISSDNKGFPQMEVVWEPGESTDTGDPSATTDSTIVLRASDLMAPITATDTTLRINPSDALVWPYQGIMQIEGEIIRYASKGYYWYDSSGNRNHVYLKSNDDKTAIDKKSNQNLVFKNAFSGYFSGLTRGLWNTYPKAHVIESVNYATRTSGLNVAPSTYGGGFILDTKNSILRLNSKNKGDSDMYIAEVGATNDPQLSYFGTKLLFPKDGYTKGAGGIAINIGPNDSGYFLEIERTAALGTTGRNSHNEVNFYIRKTDGSFVRLSKGIVFPVSVENWYDIDIEFKPGSSDSISIMIDGTKVFDEVIPANMTLPNSGRFGLFVRGDTECNFAYLYAQRSGDYIRFESSNLYDRIKGGFTTVQSDQEFVWAVHTINQRISAKKSKKVQDKYRDRFFDEFGPVVHEVREFNIPFNKDTPCIYSNLFFTNTSQVVCPIFRSTPFSAHFILENSYRENAILSGEDTLTYGPDHSITQTMVVYGRMVYQDAVKTITIKNNDAIRRRGVTEVDFDSTWIQSESAARSIANWINMHWSERQQEITVQVVGNPLIQLTDLVDITFPEGSMDIFNSRYFVIGVSQSWDGGLNTNLTLRRANVTFNFV